MSNIVFIDDFPEGTGGGEQVNNVLASHVGEVEWLKSTEIERLSKDAFYIIGNTSQVHPTVLNEIKKLNYIILEHDYKICRSRHPWRYDDNIVPEKDRVDYDLYENAKAIFVQTTDHLEVFKKNDVKGNFINLESTLWSNEDLHLLEKYRTKTPRHLKYGVLDTDIWIKNTKGAKVFCEANQLDYELIESSHNREHFINSLSDYSTLVFFPIARESCCRLVVEARCLSMNVITSKNYGAVLEPWFTKSGDSLIKFLRENTEKNLKIIEKYLK
jgi:hypothetical protein